MSMNKIIGRRRLGGDTVDMSYLISHIHVELVFTETTFTNSYIAAYTRLCRIHFDHTFDNFEY